MVDIDGRKAAATGILAKLKEPGNVAKKAAASQGLVQRGLRQKSDFAIRGVDGLMLLERETKRVEDAAMTNEELALKIKELKATGLYEYVEPDWIVTVQQVPTDSAFTNGSLWGLRNTGQSGGTAGVDVNAVPAWALTTGSPTVVVGVVDTGIRYTHQDLAGSMWTNPGEVAGNGIDDDSNGYVDDVHGINGITGSGNPMDDNNHGSHCAGTIAATGNDAGQHVGVAYNVKLMGLKFLSASGSGQTSDAIRCIDYGVAKGAHILSNSWGGGPYSQALRDSIAAANAAGVLFVAAAGNSASNNDTTANYPSNYDPANVVAVAAVDRTGALASFSSYGASTVDLGAPGVDILSSTATSNTSYDWFDGTSMATPHVAGVAALIKSRFPAATATEIKTRLLASTRPLASLTARTVTGGIADAHAALTIAADGVLEVRVAAASNPLRAGTTTAFYVTVTDLAPITGATVTGRLGAGATTTFLDGGVSPDATANDGVYSANFQVPATGSSVSLEVQAVAGGAPATGAFPFQIITPPANDDFANRILLQAGSSQTTGSNRLSSLQTGEPKYPNVAGGKSVWWEWVSGTTGSVTITTAGSSYDTTLAIYSGSPAFGSLTHLGSNDDYNGLSSTVVFNVTNGARYYVQVNGYAGDEGSITLNYPSPAAVNTPPVIVSQPNGAILVAGDPLALSVTATGTAPLSYQWFLDTTPISGATTASYSVASVAEAHEGNYKVTLTNPYGSITSASVFVGVDPISVRPPNDAFSAAETLPGATGRVLGTNQRASGEPGEPNHAGVSTPLESVWYLWTAPADGNLSVDTYGSSLDTTLAIYTGGTVGALTEIASNNDSGGVQSFVTAAVTAGQVLSIAVDGAGTLESIFALNYHFQPKVLGLANDAFANRTVVAGAPGVITGSNIGATGEADEPAHTALSSPVASVWWSWTAPVDGVAVVDTLSSNFDTEVAVYTGSSVAALTLVAANGDAGGPQSRVAFPCTAGTSYAIAVDGRGTSEGGILLNIAVGPTEPEIVLEHPAGTSLVDGLSSVSMGSVATGEVVTRQFSVRNTGGARLNGVSVIIDGANPGDFTLTTPPASFVTSGGLTTFTLQFSPAALGSRTAMLRVTSNDADEHPFDIALSGSGVLPAPEIVVEQPAGAPLTDGAATVAYGSAVVGQGTDRVFTVRNTGNATLSGVAVSFGGTYASDYSVTTLPAASLAPAASTTFTVRFAPGAVGARNATLMLASNDGDEAPFDIVLTGGGTAEPPTVRTLTSTDRGWYGSTGEHDPVNDNYLTGYSASSASPHTRSFFVFTIPTLGANETVVSAELRLTNPSNGYGGSDSSETLEIHEVTTPVATLVAGTGGVPVFTDLADGPLLGAPVTVPASSSASTVSIPLNSTFAQAVSAASGGSVALGGVLAGIDLSRTEYLFGWSAGSAGQAQLVLTTVTSYSDAEIAVEQPAGSGLVDGVANVNFGGIAPGSTVDRTFTIRNVGILPLTGLGITLDGANAGEFSVTASPAPPLAPAGSTTFTVRFAPTAGGLKTAALHIASNDPDENPFDLTLSGTSVVPAPEIAVEQPVGTSLVDGTAAVNFGYRATGASNSLVFTVLNTGTASLSLPGITIDGAHAADFTVTAAPAASVPVGGSTTFTVQFAPAAVGARTALLHLANDDWDEGPFDITLNGMGYLVPVGLDFQILTLETSGSAVVDHNSITGDDHGGIAVSTDRVFVTGDSATSRHALTDLSGGASIGRLSDGLCGDVGTGTAYVLAHNGVEISGGGTVSQLIALNPQTGALTGNIIPLSMSIVMSGSYSGVFSGNGRVVLYNGARMFDVLVPSGVVSDLGPMTRPNWQGSETWASWGVAEFFAGELWVAYRSSAGQSIVRTRVTDGVTQTIATFTNLGDMASWTVSPITGRWYFHHEYSSQFGGSSETVGYANATFALGPPTQPPVITSPLAASAYVGLPFSYAIRASRSPTAYNATGLPAGLSVNTSTGVISGLATTNGTYPVAISATNIVGTTTATLNLTVGTALTTVSLFADSAHVNTANLMHLQNALTGMGCAVTTFTGVTPAAWDAAFAVSEVVVVPNMVSYLNTGTLAASINSQLYAGKALVVAGSSNVDESFFSELRGWNMQEAGSYLTGGLNLTKAPGVPGFANSPGTLPSRTATHVHSLSSMPEAVRSIYLTAAYTGAFVGGRVAGVGYDWSSGPDAAWDAVLKDTLIAVRSYVNAPEVSVELQGTSLTDGSLVPTNVGSVPQGLGIITTFTIRNHGFSDLTGTNITVDGANAGDFTISTSPASSVAPMGSTTFNVRFSPSATGFRYATLRIASNDADESPFDLNLVGTGYLAIPEIAVEQPAGTGLTDGVSSSAFGPVTTGLNSSLVFTIRNSGTGPLTGLVVTIDGADAANFAVTTSPTAPVQPSGSTTFAVRFSPTLTGPRSAVLHISSNDGDENPFDVALTGIGVAPVPEIVLEQPAGTNLIDGTASIGFGADAVGGAGISRTFTLRNPGTGTLAGVAVTLGGAHVADYSITAHPVSSVSPGSSTVFTVLFAPSTTGTRTATLQVSSNDADENPFDVVLTGSGVPAAGAVALFANGSYVDTSVGGEVQNTLAALQGAGYVVTTFTGITEADWNQAFAAPVVVIPDQELASLSAVLSTAARAAINSHLAAGKGLLVIGDYSSNDTQFLNGLRGWSLVNGPDLYGSSLSKAAGLPGFPSSPATLTGANGTYAITTASLPAGSQLVYSSGANAGVFVNGSIAYLGYDWYAGTNSAWGLVLVDALREISAPVTGAEIVVEQPAGTTLLDGAATAAFGYAPVGGEVVRVFTVRNIGPQPLTSLGVTFDGPHAADFTVTAAPAGTVAPASSTSFTVRFSPSASGNRTAALHLASNDANESPFEIELRGTTNQLVFQDDFDPGIDSPLWAAFGGSVTANTYGQAAGTGSSGNSLYFDGTGSRFATTVPLDTSGGGEVSFKIALGNGATSTWELADSGEEAVLEYSTDGTSFTQIGGPYTNRAWQTMAAAIPAGARTAATRFRWRQLSNSGASYDHWAIEDVLISGTATLPAEIAIEQPAGTGLTDGVSNVNLGYAAVGSNTSLAFTVRNTGMQNLTGLGITFDGAHGADFTVTSSPAAPVLPGGSTTFVVRFAPSASGDRTAVLHLASNDTDENPFDIILTGTTVPQAIYGNRTPLPANSNNGPHYLLGSRLTVTSGGPLQLFGVDVRATGPNASFGLYSDVGGEPGTLVAQTGSFNFNTTGHIERPPLVPVVLAPGNYWLMAVYDGAASVGKDNSTSNILKYRSLTFTNNLPTTFGTAASYTGENINYYIRVGIVTPAITTVSPTSGGTVGGTSVTITGSGLSGATAVSFGGTPAASFAVVNDTTITATTAAHAAGVVDVTVVTPAGTATRANSFTYVLLEPEIVVELPAGTGLTDGAFTAVLPTTVAGGQSTLTFTIRNEGAGILNNLGVTIDGTNAAEFAVTAAPVAALGASNTTTFTVSFAPVAVGTSIAALRISSNDADENPFDVQLVGVSAVTSTQTITATDRGWYRSNGTHTPTNSNYLTGTGTTSPYLEFRSFFIFTIPALAPGEIISGAELRLQNPAGGFNSADASEMLKISPVTTGVASLAAGTGGTAAFADLADGTAYGGPHMVSASDNESYVVIPLNAQFLAAAQAQAGTAFALGCSVSSLRATPLTTGENIFNGTSDGFSTTLVLTRATVAPEIAVEQPVDTSLTDGAATVSFGASAGPVTRTFTVRNFGSASLTGLGMTIDGANAADFTVTAPASAPLAAAGDTTFTVRFAPSAMGSRMAVLHIASNDVDESPFDINLSGSGLSALAEFDSWVPVELPDRAAAAIPHHDGVPNLMKYAFNMDASRSDNRVMARGTGTAGLPLIAPAQAGATPVFRFEFLRRIGSGLVYTPQRSSSLVSGSWTPLTSTPTVVPVNAQWERVIYEEPVTDAMSFGRVEVTLPAP